MTQPAPETAPAKPSIPLWLIFGLVALLAVGGVVAVRAVLDLRADKDEISHPDTWDKRVLPYARLVEKKRGLTFLHPVEVEFLTDEQFRKQVTKDEEDLSEDEREEIEQATGMLRALGLIEGEVDLFEQSNRLSGSSTIGYYSYEDQRIRIRGSKLSPASRSTLVHELTHVLQDQHFGLADRLEEDDEDSTAAAAFRAVVEGDARRVEAAYAAGLTAQQRSALQRSEKASQKAARKDIANVPEILKTFTAAPYTLGEALVAVAAGDGGNDAVDALFEDPPTTDEHLLDPWSLLEDDEEAHDVDEPDLEDGDDEFDDGDFGALGFYLVLAERLPLADALDAADGWGGDAYVAFERDDVSCVRVSYQGDTSKDVDQLHKALSRWIRALPGSPATVTRSEEQLTFESCDPGSGTDVGSESSGDALQLAVLRTQVALSLVNEGASGGVARCFGTAIVHEYSIAQLTDPTFGRDDPAFIQRIQAIARGCR